MEVLRYMKKIICDLDNTITIDGPENYAEKKPNLQVVNMLKDYHRKGFSIVIHTARSMRTYEGDTTLIAKHTLPTIIDWLNKHKVPFDEVVVGKPWCGTSGFYVDDRAIRPSEFVKLSYSEITALMEGECLL